MYLVHVRFDTPLTGLAAGVVIVFSYSYVRFSVHLLVKESFDWSVRIKQ